MRDYLRNQGFEWNHQKRLFTIKKIRRVYREMKLKLRVKPEKQLPSREPVPLAQRFFPKGSDFTIITYKDKKFAENRLNSSPRKCLDIKTQKMLFSMWFVINQQVSNNDLFNIYISTFGPLVACLLIGSIWEVLIPFLLSEISSCKIT